jgi:hypothetical protein
VVRNNIGSFFEPEGGKLVKDIPFARNATGQNNIKGRDAIGRYYKKFIS